MTKVTEAPSRLKKEGKRIEDVRAWDMPGAWWQLSDHEAKVRYATEHPVSVPRHQAHEGKWIANLLRANAPKDEPREIVRGVVFCTR